jgi:hypothetical protein
MYVLKWRDGKALPTPTTLANTTLLSGDLVLRSDSRFSMFRTYRRETDGLVYTNENAGRWTAVDGKVTYYEDAVGDSSAWGSLAPDSISLNHPDATHGFVRAIVTDPTILSERGSYSLTVSGALSGSTTAADTGKPPVGQGDYILITPQNANVRLSGRKATSGLGPPAGNDQFSVELNPSITNPGSYANDSCPFQWCVAISYTVSTGPAGSGVTTAGTLTALTNDPSSTVVVETLSPWHVKLSYAGKLQWITPRVGQPPKYDTVSATASFNAFRVR